MDNKNLKIYKVPLNEDSETKFDSFVPQKIYKKIQTNKNAD
jgi:hypothetical protein